MQHTWASQRSSHTSRSPPPTSTPPPASQPPSLLTLYSSQHLSICFCWSMGLTRSISTQASASLITSSLHGWVFKDNWAQEPTSLWVTVGWNDNQLDPVRIYNPSRVWLDLRLAVGFPVLKMIFERSCSLQHTFRNHVYCVYEYITSHNSFATIK